MPTPQELVEGGLVADVGSLLRVQREIVDDGAARGTRALTVIASRGLTLRVLLDRGMDVGETWFAGNPVSWQSQVGETAPGCVDDSEGWLDGWGGGLVTTCGLRNVGLPSEGEGQHGSLTDQAATEVTISRRWLVNGEAAVDIEGTLVEASSLGRRLTLRRRITVATGAGVLDVADCVRNDGAVAEQAPILYHVNFGSPMLSAGSQWSLSGWSTPSNEGPANNGGVMGDLRFTEDRIVEYVRSENGGGTGTFAISSPDLNLAAEVTWDVTALHRVHTWQRWVAGSYVMSVEPANCSLKGRFADREDGSAPILEPRQIRRTGVSVRFYPADGSETPELRERNDK